MVRTAEEGLFCVERHKTQVRGRSNRAIAARPMVCSGHEGKSKGDRENPESNGLDLIWMRLRKYFEYFGYFELEN